MTALFFQAYTTLDKHTLVPLVAADGIAWFVLRMMCTASKKLALQNQHLLNQRPYCPMGSFGSVEAFRLGLISHRTCPLRTRRVNALPCPDAKAPILWPPDVKSRLIGKDLDAGKD